MGLPSIPTRSPSARIPHDTALREARAAITTALANGVTPRELVAEVIHAARGLSLGGPRERVEADTIAAIIDGPPTLTALEAPIRAGDTRTTTTLRVTRVTSFTHGIITTVEEVTP